MSTKKSLSAHRTSSLIFIMAFVESSAFRLLKNESVPRVFNISLYKGVTLKGK